MDGALNKVCARPIKLAGSAQLYLTTNRGREGAPKTRGRRRPASSSGPQLADQGHSDLESKTASGRDDMLLESACLRAVLAEENAAMRSLV